MTERRVFGIVGLRDILPDVGPPRLFADEGRAADERSGQAHVLDNAALRKVAGRLGLQVFVGKDPCSGESFLQPFPGPENICPFPHRLLEVHPDLRRALRAVHEPVEPLLLALDLRRINPLLPLLRPSCSIAGPLAEDLRLGKGIAAEPVGAVHAPGHFTAGKESRQGCPALGRDPEPAHDVVGGRGYFHGGHADVHAELEELFEHHRQPGLDLFPGQVGDIEEYAAVRAPPPLQDLGCDRPGNHVPGREFHPLGVVDLHEPLAFAVEEHAAFAADGLGHEPAPGIVREYRAGRVELDHLHVDQLRPGPVPDRVPVARPAR